MLHQEQDKEDGAILDADSESDLSDDDVDYVPQGQAEVAGDEEDSLDELEDSSDESSEEETQTQANRLSKKGSYWNEQPPTQGRARTHNILRRCPGPVSGSTIISPKDAWELFISDNIIEEVLRCTNLEGRRAAAAKGKEWRCLDKVEFTAFIGLTLLAGGDKSWDVALRELFLDPLPNLMYKATMGFHRYEDIRRLIRFDDKRTRAVRLETDHMAAFRYVWDCFLANCKKVFVPSDCVTIDEQLVPFRGRCKFLQYMPSKPAKYGIKIFWMCDARVHYAFNGMIYTGRQPGEDVQRNLGENIVQQLSSGIRHTGPNITMDNFFTSIPLAEKLLEKNLTLVGTLRQNKPDIPPVMKPNKLREKYSSKCGFCGNMTMVSYVPKKGKAVVLLSTMHDDTAVDDQSVKRKPEVIQYYNHTKSGVDTMDQMVRTYTCKRRTRRWPMVLWHNVLDVATLNAFTSYTAQQ
ncbi:piggyBac transposable element-derived protein 4-like [Gymnodraco acuticeps]|uniref:PiggyBac transposable element-derived protein 4-like n=1 Tax=Gymnodraco acuticeps TaxID=8218 RepID=A0A6P8TMU4_GYMAC|nr:piggyBac transposable element-derived protein 4-like [Gymnodraco acuticeps]